ncbi:TPA: hypothetical protein ACPJ18_004213 [Vibrio alginolyticus]
MLPLSERIKKTARAVEILSYLKREGATEPLFKRMEWSRERLNIIAELRGKKGASDLDAEHVQVDSVATKGRELMASLGITIDTTLKEKIGKQIKENERINDLIEVQPWSKPKKTRTLDAITKHAKAYDVYRLVGADRAQSSATHTFGIYEEVRDIHRENYVSAGLELSEIVHQLTLNSPVSVNDGYQMAMRSGFDKLANNRLSRQRKGDFTGRAGKAKQKLILAAGELYSLVAFSGEPINFTVRKARQDYSNSDRSISIGEGFTKRVLWHELSHSLEHDHPEVLAMAKNFLKKRLAQSNGIRSLRDIYQDKWGSQKGVNYSPDEYTIDDGAFTPYATKFYNEADPFDIDGARATEVITMGIESLIDNESRGRLAVNDPEHFEFIVGVIAHLHDKARGSNDPTETN